MLSNYFQNINISAVYLSPENNDVIISKHISDDSVWNSATLSFLDKDKKYFFMVS